MTQICWIKNGKLFGFIHSKHEGHSVSSPACWLMESYMTQNTGH